LKASGSTDLLALQVFIEKVTIFLHATDPNSTLSEDVAGIFTEYADLLSAQGALISAAKYCK